MLSGGNDVELYACVVSEIEVGSDVFVADAFVADTFVADAFVADVFVGGCVGSGDGTGSCGGFSIAYLAALIINELVLSK